MSTTDQPAWQTQQKQAVSMLDPSVSYVYFDNVPRQRIIEPYPLEWLMNTILQTDAARAPVLGRWHR